MINGSGYVSPVYPWIPENYPGESKDYYYTPLGSLTITHGEVFRNLEGVPYYGLTLEEDGLHMYVNAENGTVLARNPTETWSFYIECPMLLDNEDILPEEWDFAARDHRHDLPLCLYAPGHHRRKLRYGHQDRHFAGRQERPVLQ